MGQHTDYLLSIVIITCNRVNELKKTIDSCMRMAGMPIEIIIIDNGSTDGSKKMLQELVSTQECQFKPFFSPINLGVSGGRNKGFEMATSDIIFFIDDDAVLNETKSETLDKPYDYMLKHSNIGALAFNIYDLKEEGYLLDSFKNNDSQNKEMLSFVGACHMLRKTNDRKYLYPPKLMYGAEERYASIIYYDMGYRVEYYSGIKVLHNPSSKTRMSRVQTHRNVMINQYVIKKLLLPRKYLFESAVYFFIRQIKREKVNVIQIFRNYRQVKTRLGDNSEAYRNLKIETVTKLSNDYGKFTLI